MTARSDHRPASSSEGKGPPDFQRASRERRKGLWRVPCLHPPTRSPVAFAQRLSAFPIVLEIVPPHRRASEKTLAGLVTKVQDAVGSVPHLDALNIPEVLDENHAGLPFYRNLGPRAFAQRLNDGLGGEAIVNKVLVDPEPISTVLREYGAACAAARVPPATVLLSFAPVADYEDIEFLVWLGATITRETEDALVAGRGREAGRASFDVARRIWTRIRDGNASSRQPVPLGVNNEEISVHNFDLAVRMAREFPAWKDAKGA